MVQLQTQGGWTATAVADALGVSPRTDYKWRAPYRTSGMAALDEGSVPLPTTCSCLADMVQFSRAAGRSVA
jgi:transposase-like protein